MTDLLEHYRARALAAVPDAEEGVSYGMPALRYRGRPLIAVIETKAGFSVYPFSPAVVEQVADELAGLTSTKGGVQLTAEHPLPDEVFDRMVAARRAEIDAALGTRRR
jgi:uncharacterized protein YdhG (YjbR/CyaY superfamily)